MVGSLSVGVETPSALVPWGWALCLGYSQMGIQGDIALPIPRALETQGTVGFPGLDLVDIPRLSFWG